MGVAKHNELAITGLLLKNLEKASFEGRPPPAEGGEVFFLDRKISSGVCRLRFGAEAGGTLAINLALATACACSTVMPMGGLPPDGLGATQ